MKAVIMAAGRGLRMGELSNSTPKHLLRVNGRPFIDYLCQRLVAAGFDELVVVVGYQSLRFRSWASTAPFPLTLVEQAWGPGIPVGTAKAVAAAHAVVGSEPFLAVGGDNLFSVRDLQKFHASGAPHLIGGLASAHPERYGVLIQDRDGRLRQIVEKPRTFVGRTVNAAVYRFGPEIFSAIDSIGVSPRGEYEVTDAINILAARQTVTVVPLHDFWIDFGRPEDIGTLEQHLRGSSAPA